MDVKGNGFVAVAESYFIELGSVQLPEQGMLVGA